MAQMFTEIRKKTKSQQAILPGYPAKAATWHLLIHLLWKDLSHRSPLDQSYKPLLSLKKQKKRVYNHNSEGCSILTSIFNKTSSLHKQSSVWNTADPSKPLPNNTEYVQIMFFTEHSLWLQSGAISKVIFFV